MKQSELNAMKISNKDGIFSPRTSSKGAIPIKDKDGNIVDEELIDFVLIKTAEEVYQEHLQNQANPPKPEPTDKERISQLETLVLQLSGVI